MVNHQETSIQSAQISCSGNFHSLRLRFSSFENTLKAKNESVESTQIYRGIFSNRLRMGVSILKFFALKNSMSLILKCENATIWGIDNRRKFELHEGFTFGGIGCVSPLLNNIYSTSHINREIERPYTTAASTWKIFLFNRYCRV